MTSEASRASSRGGSRPTICLNMIVRNEAHIIHELIASVAAHIDFWVIVDTGSTDGTQEIIRRLMAERGGVRVVADQVGTPTAVDGLAAACLRAAEGRHSGTWHWTDAGIASWYDFAVAIAEEGLAAGLLRSRPEVAPIRTEDFPTPARRPAYSVLDKTATWAALGLPARHWRDGLRDTIRTLRTATNP